MVVVELQNMEEMFAPLAAYISKLGALAPTGLWVVTSKRVPTTP